MILFKGLILLCVVLSCSVGQVSSSMTLYASNQKPVQGSNMTLSCWIGTPNGYPVSWKRANGQGTSLMGQTHMARNCSNNAGWFVKDIAYYRWQTCVAGKQQNWYNLTIIKTRVVDTGQWHCVEMNAASRSSIGIEVMVPPGIPRLTGIGFVPVGGDVTLTCNATQPGVKDTILYSWYKDGALKVNSNTLILKSTTQKDTGTYMCKARNVHGITNKTGRVEVTYQVTKLEISVSPTTLLEGRKATVTCTATGGQPTPTLTIHSSGSQWVNKSAQTQKLSMEAVMRRDDANISCSAQVKGTPLVEKRTFDIKYPPDVVLSTNPSTKEVKENTADAHLRCEAKEGNPKPSKDTTTIAWYFKGKELINASGIWWTLSLTSPNRTKSGEYRCLVSNYPGLSAWRAVNLAVIYPPEWDTAFPDKRTATAGLAKIATFSLHVLANPMPSKISWVKEVKGMVYDPSKPTPSLGYYFESRTVNARTNRLHIWRVSSADYGTYRVYVTNKAGTQFFVFTLLPPGPPYTPCCLNVASKTSVAVTISFSGNSTRENAQYEVSYRQVVLKSNMPWNVILQNMSHSGSSKTLTQKISKLKPSTTYEFRVRAANSYGKSGYTIPVKTRTMVLPFPVNPSITARKSGDVVVITWPPVRTGTKVEVLSCTPKGVCKIYLGTNNTKIGIPVKGNIFEEIFFVRYYDGEDVAYTSKAVQIAKDPPPPYRFPDYAYGIVGFIVGCLFIGVIVLIIWKVKKAANRETFMGDEFETYPNDYVDVNDDRTPNGIATIATSHETGSHLHQVHHNSAYNFEDPRLQNAHKLDDTTDEIYVNLTDAHGLETGAASAGRPSTNAYATTAGAQANQVGVSTYQSLKGNQRAMRAGDSTHDEIYMNYDPLTAKFVNKP